MRRKKLKKATQITTEKLDDRAVWEEHRTKFKFLRLSEIPGDSLNFLFSGANAQNSLRYYKRWQSSRTANERAGVLSKFANVDPFTFVYSGWFSSAVAEVILEDANAAKMFVSQFWEPRLRKIAIQTDRAYQALESLSKEHRKHCLLAVRWILGFQARSRSTYESDARWSQRAVVSYFQSRPHICECVRKNFQAYCHAAAIFPTANAAEIVDRVLAKSFQTSHSTLTHVRASANRRKR